MKTVAAIIMAIFHIIGMLPYAHGDNVRLEGLVYEATSKKGIAALTIKLIPPRTLKKAEIITTTDESGEFRFAHVERGKYLLEVYQGVTILFRSGIEIIQDTRKEIPLRSRP
jgi:hypothetical protein